VVDGPAGLPVRPRCARTRCSATRTALAVGDDPPRRKQRVCNPETDQPRVRRTRRRREV